ncbi:MAG: hypothetical protein AAFQ07_20965, partial [Chloroflexota bacterium]
MASISFEEDETDLFSLSATFDDGGFDYFNVYQVPDNTNGARDDFQLGWDGNFGIQGQDHDGDGNAVTQTVTLTAVDISSLTTPTVTLSLGALDGAPDFFNYEGDDGIEIYATVDGGTRTLVGSFAPEDGNDGGGDLLLDTDFDGIGDGAHLTTVLTPFTFALPVGDSVVIEIELSSNSSFEPLALDLVEICGNVLNIVPVTDTVTEGGDLVYSLQLALPASEAVDIDVTVTGVTASQADVSGVTFGVPTTVTIPQGTTSAQFSITTVDDADLERVNTAIVHEMTYDAVKDRLPDGMDQAGWHAVQQNISTVNEVG